MVLCCVISNSFACIECVHICIVGKVALYVYKSYTDSCMLFDYDMLMIYIDMKKAACVHALHVGILTLKSWEFSPETPHLQIIPNFCTEGAVSS